MTITTDKRDEGSSVLSNSVSQVTVVTTHPPIIHPPIDFPPPRVSIQSQADEVVIVANETNKTQINENSSDFEFLDSLEVNTGDQNYVHGQKLDESEVVIVNSNCINDRGRRGIYCNC